MSRIRVLCAHCAHPMTLTGESRDPRNLGQRVFSCPSCRLIEIRPPEAFQQHCQAI